ncbi:MAG: cell envelope integrity protein TolA [Gammaproteobacteria bacterium]|nr:cell envelope integrity protein TolA [Gammaproteobacteria bacterium]
MFDWIKENSTAFIVALIFHFLFFGALFFNWQMDKPKKIVMQQGDIIQVTSVDANSYDAEIKKIEQQKQAKLRKAEADRKARVLEKKKKQEQVRRQKEKKRQAEELKRQKAATAKKEKAAKKKAEQEKQRKKAAEKKKIAAEKLKKEQLIKEQKKKAEQEKQRLKEQKKRQEAEQKRKAAEEKKRQAELQRKEVRDRETRERRSKGVVKRHVAMIAQKIERNWRQPLDAPPKLQCKIDIMLLPSGKVVSVKVVESSGHLSFDRSVETAVRRASPLPVPSDSVIFKQFEVMRLRFEPGNY